MTSKSAEAAARLALMVVSLLAGLLLLELGCRLWRGPQWLVEWPNLPQEGHRILQPFNEQFIHDPLLGPVPKAGMRPVLGEAPGPPVLAVGDSYTWGAEVKAEEAWPALLQGLLGRRTINGGVPGYGLDQTVLRAERLAGKERPAVIVASFIADDLWRCEMRRLWGADKPWFILDGRGELVLHRPPETGPSERPITFWQRAFGWSFLINVVVARLWLHDPWTHDSEPAQPATSGERLACPLMQRLAKLAVPVLVVGQYEPALWLPDNERYKREQRRLTRVVLACAESAGLATLDTYEAIDRAVAHHGFGAIFRGDHNAPLGNRAAAEAIAAKLGTLLPK